MAKGKKYNLTALESPDDPLSRPVITYRAEIEWRGGIPHLVSAPIRVSEDPAGSMQALLRQSLDLPYDGTDPSLQGLSNAEAMIINLMRDAARGIPEARDTVLDRILGRPQQNIKSVTLSGNLNDFLDKVAKETKNHVVDVTIEAETVDPTEDL